MQVKHNPVIELLVPHKIETLEQALFWTTNPGLQREQILFWTTAQFAMTTAWLWIAMQPPFAVTLKPSLQVMQTLSIWKLANLQFWGSLIHIPLALTLKPVLHVSHSNPLNRAQLISLNSQTPLELILYSAAQDEQKSPFWERQFGSVHFPVLSVKPYKQLKQFPFYTLWPSQRAETLAQIFALGKNPNVQMRQFAGLAGFGT